MVTPEGKRKAVAHLVESYGVSERRACKAIGCCRMTIRYRTIRADDAALRQRMRAIAEVRRRFGYRRLHVLLKREGIWSTTPNDCWSVDFVSNQLTDRRRFRILTVDDECTRECLALVADTSLSGSRVARELDWARPCRTPSSKTSTAGYGMNC